MALNFSKKEDIDMENEKIEELQTTFNEDGLDILVEDGVVENLAEIEEVADNGNENN